jgi:hypothetical protein
MDYLLSTGEKVIKRNGLYYLKGGEVVMNEYEMNIYLQSQASRLEDPKNFPDTIREHAEYNWKHGY